MKTLKFTKYNGVPTDSDRERFWSKVNKISEGGCWEWSGFRSEDGYGVFYFGKKLCGAHRISFAWRNGPFVDSRLVLHKCDNPCCVNPDHLFLGTQRENVLDCMKKNRMNRSSGESHGRSVLTSHQVSILREMHKEFGIPPVVLGEWACLSKGSIHRILKGETWRSA